MNPTLLQQPPFDFPLASDHNYLGTERTYSNLGGYPSNDPFPFLSRRTLNEGTNSKPSSSLAGPTNSGAELTPQPPLTDTAYHSTAHPWLSHPDPTSGSIATGENVASSFTNATLPKPLISNVSSEQFSAISGATPPTSWRDSATTDLNRPHLSVLPRALSPHQSYTASSMNGYQPRPIMDRCLGNYSASTPMNTSFIPRPQPIVRPSHYSSFSTDNAYSAMPQSESQRQEGPPFKETRIIHQPLNAKGNNLRPQIVANIQKGFFQVDGKWTCYRRNYFSVNCSFTLSPSSPEEQVYLKKDHDAHPELIKHFAVLISAKTSAANSQDSEARDLVQHTPKRSKDTESIPVRQIVVPQHPQHPQHLNSLLPFGPEKYHGAQAQVAFGIPNYLDTQTASAPSSHTFDRIQFAKATANNGKRRAQQQYFHVVVELWASINRKHGEEWVRVATQDSDQVVVRGRSPGHYKDNNRRDSQSNMDPDRLSGPGSDESSGAHHFGSTYQSAMNWHSSHSGQLHHGQHSYHGRTYNPGLPTDGSPTSTSSSTTHTKSPHNLVFHHSDSDTLKSVDLCSLEHSRFTLPSPEAAEESFFSTSGALLSRKRPLEEDFTEDEPSFGSAYPFSESASPHTFNYLSMAPSKILCAS